MMEIRFHGRGGQGAMTAAVMLAHAAWREGIWSQKIPVYGSERRGAAVMAYLRLDDKPVRRTSAIYEPDCIVVLDEPLLKFVNVARGLKEKGIAVLNNRNPPGKVDLGAKVSKLAVVDATEIATKLFGRRPIPITNTTMLGAFSAATGLVKLESIYEAIMERFPGRIGEMNVEAAKMGYEGLKVTEFK